MNYFCVTLNVGKMYLESHPNVDVDEVFKNAAVKVEKITKKEYSSIKVRAKRDPDGYLFNYKSVPNPDKYTNS